MLRCCHAGTCLRALAPVKGNCNVTIKNILYNCVFGEYPDVCDGQVATNIWSYGVCLIPPFNNPKKPQSSLTPVYNDAKRCQRSEQMMESRTEPLTLGLFSFYLAMTHLI